MQGFNRYYPPDFDPSKTSTLNALHGKHALGDRARKIGQGILITRFELPFNIWCGHCDAHIGQGVRYNSEKKKVGNYYSTPIYSFRCKCHLCGGWFELQTDPKNTRYVVTEGARAQNQDWDPLENGGHPIQDDKAEPVDAFESLEKNTTAKERAMTEAERLAELADIQEARWSDPYTHSQNLRKSFREEKRVRVAEGKKDDALMIKYGLPEDVRKELGKAEEGDSEEWTIALGKRKAEDVDKLNDQAKIQASIGWSTAKKKSRVLPGDAKSKLAASLLFNTAKKADPFLPSSSASIFGGSSSLAVGKRLVKR